MLPKYWFLLQTQPHPSFLNRLQVPCNILAASRSPAVGTMPRARGLGISQVMLLYLYFVSA